MRSSTSQSTLPNTPERDRGDDAGYPHHRSFWFGDELCEMRVVPLDEGPCFLDITWTTCLGS